MEKFWYCGVSVKGVRTAYSYISDMGELSCGTYVEVSFGKQNVLKIGIVESCGEYAEDSTPFPVEKTKHIIRIATKEEYDDQETILPYYPSDEDECLEEANYYIEEEDWDEVLDWASYNQSSTNDQIIQKVIECYRLCMKQNMPAAAFYLGNFYYNGQGVEQDFDKAFELYRIAADAGMLPAICSIGNCYFYGSNCEIDYAQAYKYFSLGAMLYEDAGCINKLADMYLNRYSVEKNEKYAYILYESALKHASEDAQDSGGIADTQLCMGKCLLKGIGTNADVEKAHELLSLALIGFYKRRKTDNHIQGLIKSAQELINEAQKELDKGVLIHD